MNRLAPLSPDCKVYRSRQLAHRRGKPLMAAVISTNSNILINNRSVIHAQLNIEQEQIDVTTMSEPDPNWSYIDAAGHIHAYSKDYTLPTLKSVERVEDSAPDDAFTVQFHDGEEEGDENDAEEWDDDDDYTITEYHCVICDEVIVPGIRATVDRKYKPGRYSWRVEFTTGVEDVLPLNSEKVSVWMTDDDKLKVFGVGLLSVRSVDPQGIAAGSILGAGELGKR